ncbi:MAG: large repetitive protein [Solirubrobacterales bacterium]|jgi:hypothetical protein|nr:large repetitive protein [Solirubrobacterales bacterium]
MSNRLVSIALGCAVAVMVSVSSAAAAVPDTLITAGPSGPLAKATATFKFKATSSGASFECAIDEKAWASCDSPKKYKKLSEGHHAFAVRARKGRKADKTPASSEFTVDTLAPETTVDSGPYDLFATHNVRHYTEDQTPDFTFHSSESGSFECRITSEGSTPQFEPCGSPFSPTSPLPRDVFYTFEVRAIDEAGNNDPTAGTFEFSVDTPVTEDPQTAAAAAAYLFPNASDWDVPADCDSSSPVDCPNGNPLPADDDQLSTASARSLQAVAGTHRYDVSVTYDAHTTSPIVVYVMGADCSLTINSANGANPHWSAAYPLNFVIEAASGRVRVEVGDLALNNIEAADFSLSGGAFCLAAQNQYLSAFRTQVAAWQAARMPNLCAAPGPDYLGPCPEL